MSETTAQSNPANPSQLSPAETLALAHLKLIRAIRSSGNWFYWIAGLSLVNTLISTFGGTTSFIVGLGITQVVDAFASPEVLGDSSSGVGIARVILLFINLLIMGVFVFFGFHANKARSWAFIVGIILYTLDGLLFLLVGDWLSIAFHLFVLWRLVTGIQAVNKLKKLNQLVMNNTNFTPA